MTTLFPRFLLVAGLGLAAAACTPYPPAPGYGNNAYNTGYYNNAPYGAPPPRYGYGQPAPYYYGGGQQQGNGWYNKADGRRYTTVTVTNRGQNGYRDQVVQQQVVCGSQYYDGYQTRTAPSC